MTTIKKKPAGRRRKKSPLKSRLQGCPFSPGSLGRALWLALSD